MYEYSDIIYFEVDAFTLDLKDCIVKQVEYYCNCVNDNRLYLTFNSYDEAKNCAKQLIESGKYNFAMISLEHYDEDKCINSVCVAEFSKEPLDETN